MAYTFARRLEIARSKGYENYNQYRKASAPEREQRSRELARKEPSYKADKVVAAQNARSAAKPSHIVKLPDGEVLTTRGGDKVAQVERSIMAKGRSGRAVEHLVIKYKDAGGKTRTAMSGGKGRQSMSSVRSGLIAAGGLAAYVALILDAMYGGGADASDVVEVQVIVV